MATGWLLIFLGLTAAFTLFAVETSSDAWWSVAGLLMFGVPGYFLVFRTESRQKQQSMNDMTSK